MGPEVWDQARKKWVLYRSQAEHSADCAKHSFERIPRRIFLDTNVINLLVKYPFEVFEQAAMPGGLDLTRADDVEALMHVFHVGARARWDILASSKTLDEIQNTPDHGRAASPAHDFIRQPQPAFWERHAVSGGRRDQAPLEHEARAQIPFIHNAAFGRAGRLLLSKRTSAGAREGPRGHLDRAPLSSSRWSLW